MQLKNLALAALVGLGANTARAEVTYGTGVPLNRDGWVLTTTDAVSGCAGVETTAGESAETIIRDERDGLAAIRFDFDRRRGSIAINLRSPSRGQDVVVVGFPAGTERDRPFGQTAEVAATTGRRGDSTRITASLDGALDAAGPAILNEQAQLVALVDQRNRRDDRRPYAVKPGVITRFLDSEGIRFASARRSDPSLSAQEVYNSTLGKLVQIACLDEGAVSGQGQGGDDAAEAATFISDLMDQWSSPNTRALNGLRNIYAAQVDYYGRETSARSVLADKRRFAGRWPLRSYSARPETIVADCFRGFCLVSGELDFFAFNPDSGNTSRGVARFEYDLDLTNGRISREAGSVLRGQSGAPEAMIDQWRERSLECRRNRSVCDLRDYTETVLRGFDLCVNRSGRGRVSACQAEPTPTPPPTPAPAPQPDPVTPADPERETVSSSSEFIRGTTPVSIALFATDLPRDGRVEIFVDGSIMNLDPGTPGTAQFYLKVNGQERELGSPVELVNQDLTTIAIAETLDIERTNLPVGPVTLEILFRTNRRSIHTRHDTKTQVRVRNDG